MRTEAEYLADSLACEKIAKEFTEHPEARALFLRQAAWWRMRAETAAAGMEASQRSCKVNILKL